MTKKDATVINVLPESYFRKEHIPGSINIPHEQPDFVDQVGRHVNNKDDTIIVYCGSEACDASPKAAQKLENAGYRHVYDFEGGMEAWKQAGEAVESAAART